MKRFRRWLAFGVSAVVIVLMSWDLIFSDHGYFVYQDEYHLQQKLEADIKILEAEKRKVKQNIIQLRENPKVLEEVIHRELGYVYPDEYMLIMPETTQDKYNKIQQRSGHE